MTRYVLGIDGGGTSTKVAIVDETGRISSSATAGPGNYDDVGVAQAQANIQAAVDAARASAGLDDAAFASAFLGIAGVVSAEDRDVVHGIAARLELAPTHLTGVDHDCRVALAGGLSGRPGIVIIAGTGSSVYGRSKTGDSWRSGGWGHLIADEGSSYWLGMQGMRSAVAAYDGRRPPTLLTERVMQHLNLSDMNQIMKRIYVPPLTRSEVAALAPVVIEAAHEGDPQALALIDKGAQEIADCVLAVAQRLHMHQQHVEVTAVGGLLNAGIIVTAPLYQHIHEHLPQCRIIAAEMPPALGAALLALEQLHGSISQEIIARILQSDHQV